ncbi:acyl-CoA dehydrogenase [Spongiactinospora sp. TRM90649]|uniref:acyl-CoA dehydrogenase n=1 Tax=Spongiactinospora sp. TRM90649 TaxID=3031114 RepID=UPI0023F7A19A|nr:acyl-CoA dehydrogenase [Spongiactinospora sp. TRM90649]MDF5755121.1 acyl-CoA dehydrogenase [Spongiactinospora sp. TRM90649]
MTHYRSNVRDIEFNLFEVLGTDRFLGSGALSDLDRDACRDILAEVARLAEGPLAASFADADRDPPAFFPATGDVVLPDSLKKAYAALRDAQWWRLEAPPELGGIAAPRTLVWAVAELILGANPVAHMYGTGVPFAAVVHREGTPEQRGIAAHMIERGWGATMALTEPDAGSDVGAGRTTAVPQGDGTWHLEGVKRFITSGEHDLAENIVHLVLARPVGAEAAGTKGLSLFIVPKFLFSPVTGEPSVRNGVRAANLERKMGIKASTTCELRFGEREPAVGFLLGDVHDGIAQMFHVIEHTRMMVGVKAVAALSSGYLHALGYARARVQSADLTRLGDRNAPRVTIVNHPDVRRSLMLTKAYAEGLRALALYTADWQDRVAAGERAGADVSEASAVNALLLPIVKGVGSERSYEQLAHALAVLGGSGYLQDYPLEQYVRDTKVDTLYEGTTAIQGQDLFFRKIVKDRRKALDVVLAEIAEFLRGIDGDDRLRDERRALTAALDAFTGMVEAMLGQAERAGQDPRELYKAGQNTTRLLMCAGDLMVGYLLLRQAATALRRMDQGRLSPAAHAFYLGKTAVARFFSLTVLPLLDGHRTIAEGTDNHLMDVPETAF